MATRDREVERRTLCGVGEIWAEVFTQAVFHGIWWSGSGGVIEWCLVELMVGRVGRHPPVQAGVLRQLPDRIQPLTGVLLNRNSP